MLKVNQFVGCELLEDISFWGGIHIKKGTIIKGVIKRFEKFWVSILGLAIPLDKVQIILDGLNNTNCPDCDSPDIDVTDDGREGKCHSCGLEWWV